MESIVRDNGRVLFFLDEPERPARASGTPVSRLAAARAALRDAQQAEWAERQRLARVGVDATTPVHAALLAARQAQTQAAEAAVTELRRRAASLRHALTLAEEALAVQRRLTEKLRRELSEIGD